MSERRLTVKQREGVRYALNASKRSGGYTNGWQEECELLLDDLASADQDIASLKAERESLQAQIADTREALEPFAAMSRRFGSNEPDTEVVWRRLDKDSATEVTSGGFRKAQSALSAAAGQDLLDRLRRAEAIASKATAILPALIFGAHKGLFQHEYGLQLQEFVHLLMKEAPWVLPGSDGIGGILPEA
jgi:hypothetical protein